MADFDAMLQDFLVDLNGDGVPDVRIPGNYNFGPVTEHSRAGRMPPSRSFISNGPTARDAVQSALDTASTPAKAIAGSIGGVLDAMALPGDVLTGRKQFSEPAAMVPDAVNFAGVAMTGGAPLLPGGAIGTSGGPIRRAWNQLADNPVAASSVAGSVGYAMPHVRAGLGGDAVGDREANEMALAMGGIGAAPAAARAIGRHIIAPAAAGLGSTARRWSGMLDEIAPQNFNLGSPHQPPPPPPVIPRPDLGGPQLRADTIQTARDSIARVPGQVAAMPTAIPRLDIPDEVARGYVAGSPDMPIRGAQFVKAPLADMGRDGPARAYLRREVSPTQIEERNRALARDERARDATYGMQNERSRVNRLAEYNDKFWSDELGRATVSSEMRSPQMVDAFDRAPAATMNALAESTGIPVNRLLKYMEESGYDLSHMTRDRFLSRTNGKISGAEPGGMAMFNQIRNSPVLYRQRMPHNGQPETHVGPDDLPPAAVPKREAAPVNMLDPGSVFGDLPKPPPRTVAQSVMNNSSGGVPYEGFSHEIWRALDTVNPKTAAKIMSNPAEADKLLRSIIHQHTRDDTAADKHIQVAREVLSLWAKARSVGGA